MVTFPETKDVKRMFVGKGRKNGYPRDMREVISKNAEFNESKSI